LMRPLLHQYTDRHLRDGPFIMQLTDLHIGNIFVDKDWNIKNVSDLEWVCSLPLENMLPPWWLTGKAVDEIEGSEYERFQGCYNQFMDTFEQEENNMPLYYNRNHYPRAA